MQTSLEGVTREADKAESSLKDLDKSHTVKLNDSAIDTAQREIARLRDQMRHDLSIDATANVKGAQARIRQLQSAVRTLDAETVEIQASVNVDDSELEELDGSSLAAQGGISALGGKLGSLGKLAGPLLAAGGVAAVGVVAGKAIANVIGLADKLENARIAFVQFLGSGDAADKFLNNLQQFAAKTPFEFPELVESSKRLLAFGIESGDVLGVLGTLGDAAALTGASVDDLATIWGQMSAKGKVSNEELLQLTEAGIPAYDALSKAMGKPVPVIQKMAENGKLLSDATLPKLQRELGKTFGGGMAKQAETLGGKVSTLHDTITNMGTSVGQALLPFAESVVDEVQPALDDLAVWVKDNKGTIAASVTEGLGSMLDMGASVLDAFAGITDAIGSVIEWVGNLTVNIGVALNLLGKLPGVADNLGDSAIDAGQNMIAFGEGAHTVSDAMHGTADGLRVAADKARKFGQNLKESLDAKRVKERVTEIQANIARLKKKPPTQEVTARIDRAQAKLRQLRKEVRDTTRSEKLVRVNADIRQGKKNVDKIRDALKNLRSQKQTTKVKADITDWTAKLKTAKAKVAELKDNKATLRIQLDKGTVTAVGNDLAKLAKPGGKARNAPVDPTVDPGTLARETTKLDRMAEARYATIYVRTVRLGGGGGDGPTAGPTLAPVPAGPELLGAAAAMLATPTPTATATGTFATGPVPTLSAVQAAALPATRLAPQRTPVKVYIDGEEVATHLELRARRFAPPTIRRRA